MNLKEAFRFQNRLKSHMDEVKSILLADENITVVKQTLLLHKVNPDAQDESSRLLPDSEYAGCITELAAFMMYLLDQRQLLSVAIRKAKAQMDTDFDGELSLNAQRQDMAELFRSMCDLRALEKITPGGGMGYKFNAEGNQVSYRCDLKTVISINFDRAKIRSYLSALSKKSEQVSAELDRQLINTTVEFEPPFDVNDSFAEVFEGFMAS